MRKKILGQVSLRLGHLLVQNRPDDQYLVSYPRSGNTWMRTILVNLLVPGTDSDPVVFNKRLPGVSIRRSRMINALPSPRLIKSHTWYRRDIPRALYLVRDGRDALVSYYHYLISRRGKQKPFDQFFDEYMKGYHGYRWDQHVLSWLQNGRNRLGDDLLIINFEQFRQHTTRVIEEVCQFYTLEFSPAEIQQAVESASLENMRRMEQRRYAPDQDDPNALFYRGGKQRQWVDLLTGEQLDRFMAVSTPALQAAGYDV